MKLKNKKVLVYGLGESGLGTIELLKTKRAKILLYDDNINALQNFECDFVTKIEAITENFLESIDLIVVNPSISIFNENLKLAAMLNIKIISEIELAFSFKKGKVVSITGSNGKSTTSTLIYNIFKQAKMKTSLVGNIGNSFCKEVSNNKKQAYIVEVSSFQLETINKYRSNTACFLNFTENHLDRHFSIKNYFETKCKIFKNSKNKDFIVLNFDDEKVRSIKANKNTFYFSKTAKVKGTFVLDDYICFNNGQRLERVVNLNQIKLLGKHNLENVLCAILVAKLNKIKNEDIIKAVESFYGIDHRISFVEEINGIKYYNDSKSTTCKATLTALNCFKSDRVLLILGGSDKGFEFTPLFDNLPNCVKNIVVIGEVKDKILLDAKKHNFYNIMTANTFEEAIFKAKLCAESEGLNVVLLSPATASFDMFNNFEERGRIFEKLVKEFNSETKI